MSEFEMVLYPESHFQLSAQRPLYLGTSRPIDLVVPDIGRASMANVVLLICCEQSVCCHAYRKVRNRDLWQSSLPALGIARHWPHGPTPSVIVAHFCSLGVSHIASPQVQHRIIVSKTAACQILASSQSQIFGGSGPSILAEPAT